MESRARAIQQLHALTPQDGRYADKLQPLANIWSEYSLIKHRVEAELKWFEYLMDLLDPNTLSAEDRAHLKMMIDNFSDDDALSVKSFEKVTRHDVKAVEYFIQEKFKQYNTLDENSALVHFGITSEDVNSVAYASMMQKTLNLFIPELISLQHLLVDGAHAWADIPLLARTHGQPATPTTVGKEFANFANRLSSWIEELRSASTYAKWNGATGNYNALSFAYPEHDWPTLCEKFIENLGLKFNAYTTQIEPHDYIAKIAKILSSIATVLTGFDRDMWHYISLGYFSLKKIDNEVGSSTMPHKINPIDFENSEGNFLLAPLILNGIADKLLTARLQRDLTDSTVLRNLGLGMSFVLLGLISLSLGLSKISPNIAELESELKKHWELVAEPTQTEMRKHRIKNSYELLKAFSRGEKLNQEQVHQFFDGSTILDDVKLKLKTLRPETYLGAASKLAKAVKKASPSLTRGSSAFFTQTNVQPTQRPSQAPAKQNKP